MGTSKSSLTIFLHVIIWTLLGFILLFYPPFTWSVKVPASFWMKQVFNLVLMASAFYLNAFYVVPALLFQKAKWKFGAWLVIAVTGIMLLARMVEVGLHVPEQMAKLHNRIPRSSLTIDVYLLMVALIVMAVSTSLAMIKRWQTDVQLHERIERQHIASELALLKAQINPHFFFNTLNNIYALTFSDIPVSREAILKLSRMMRYVLYDTLQDASPMSQEIAFLNDFISLMKLRLHERTKLEFNVSVADGAYLVAPMLLLPFIENAFKHGTSALQDARIVIDLRVENGVLKLRVWNHISHEKDSYGFDRGGIGLANTQKRLNLLYPEKHSLRISEDTDKKTFEVLLTIDVLKGPAESPKNEIELHHS